MLSKTFLICLVVFMAAVSAEEEKSGMELLKSRIANYLAKKENIKIDLEMRSSSNETSRVIQRITGRGLAAVAKSTKIQLMEGVNKRMLSRVSPIIMRMMSIPKKLHSELDAAVWSKLTQAGPKEWLLYKILFSVDEETSRYVCLLANNGKKGFNFGIANLQSSFQLAPDLLVVEKQKDSAWGDSTDTDIIIQEVPKKSKLTGDDLDLLIKFFDLAMFSKFGEMMGISRFTPEKLD